MALPASVAGPHALPVALRSVAMRFEGASGPVEALRDLDLDLPAGSFASIIGPNGCGKSTLLRLAAGLLSPTQGSVLVGDRPPRPGDGRAALAFQQPRLVPWRTTVDNVALPLEVAGVPLAQRQERASIALARVGLSAAADVRPASLSGGMAQRAALARALVGDPPVLLLDEPFSALDALTREAFNAELRALWRERGCTVVLVTHSVDEATTIGDHVVVMAPRPGRVLMVRRASDAPARTAALRAEVRSLLAAEHPAELRAWTEDRVGGAETDAREASA